MAKYSAQLSLHEILCAPTFCAAITTGIDRWGIAAGNTILPHGNWHGCYQLRQQENPSWFCSNRNKIVQPSNHFSTD